MPKKDPNAPKRPLTAYFIFTNDIRPELKEENPDWKVGDIAKEAGRRWKEMDDEDKTEYNEKAAELKKEYQVKLAEYEANKGSDDEDEEEDEGPKKRKRKAKKDPNAPKRPLSAYFIFTNDIRAELKEENPDWKIGDIAKECGRRWGEMDDEDKTEYTEKAAELKKEYQVKLAEYEANKGSDDEDEDEEEKPKKKRKTYEQTTFPFYSNAA